MTFRFKPSGIDPKIFKAGPCKYEVYSDGRIYSSFFRRKSLVRLQVYGSRQKRGYVSISIGGTNRYLHRIIAMCFVPNPDNKSEINHKNGIKHDNRAENLEWATRSENTQHTYDVLNRYRGAAEDRGGGVFYDKNRKKWTACLCLQGKSKQIGRFATKGEALKARREAFRNRGVDAF